MTNPIDPVAPLTEQQLAEMEQAEKHFCWRCEDTGIVHPNDPISDAYGFETGPCYCTCPKGRETAATDAKREREADGEFVTLDFGFGDTLTVHSSQIITCEATDDDDIIIVCIECGHEWSAKIDELEDACPQCGGGDVEAQA
jgi:ssDNA-binding Zn-finger/Zn-ribbon topoisomerase 1